MLKKIKKLACCLILLLVLSLTSALLTQSSYATGTCLGGKGECHPNDGSGEKAGLVYCSNINNSNSDCDQYYYCYAANYSLCSSAPSDNTPPQTATRTICNITAPPAPGYENSPTSCPSGTYLQAYNDGSGLVSACYQIPSGYEIDPNNICNIRLQTATRTICGVTAVPAPGYENSPTNCNTGYYLQAYNDGSGLVSSCYQIPAGYQRDPNDVCKINPVATPAPRTPPPQLTPPPPQRTPPPPQVNQPPTAVVNPTAAPTAVPTSPPITVTSILLTN